MQIYVDFDNTLIVHSDDLDQPHNKGKGLEWYLQICKGIEFKLSLAGLLLVQWLNDYDFCILTARGDRDEYIPSLLFDLFGYVPNIIYCNGGQVKRDFLASQNKDDYFLIDNNPVYEPDFLFKETFRKADLTDIFNQKLKETHARRVRCYG